MVIFDKNKLGWWTRIKLCWSVLTTGAYNPKDYRTRDAQKQWDICQKRQAEMDACIQPRTETHEWRTSSSDNRLHYTDYDERNKFRKPDAKPGLYNVIL